MQNNISDRQKQILELLHKDGEVKVDKLTIHFGVSEVSIRKDLQALDNYGLLVRNYGGAVLVSSIERKYITSSKNQPQISIEKANIAQVAIKYIKDNSRIILDSGSTTAALITLLNQKSNLVVMTNSLATASKVLGLSNRPSLLMTGGTWDEHSASFQGQVAEQALQAYDFDQLFIGADGLDLARGTTTFNELTGLSAKMADVSKQVIVLAESKKIMRKIPNLELAWDKIDILITDSGITAEQKKNIESHNIEVIVA